MNIYFGIKEGKREEEKDNNLLKMEMTTTRLILTLEVTHMDKILHTRIWKMQLYHRKRKGDRTSLIHIQCE